MKSELSLTQFARELERQQHAKRDFIAHETAMQACTVLDDGGTSTVVMALANSGSYTITPHAHGQLAQHVHIPRPYYQLMLKEAPALLCTNLNHWLHNGGGSQRIVRTLDQSVRGFLSSSYRPLDHYDFAEVALQTLHRIGDIDVEACAITDTRMYLKAVSKRLQGEVRVGDIVQWGVALSNSEVGAGKLRIDPLIFRLSCTNGAVSRQDIGTYERRHVGRKVFTDRDVAHLLSDEARQADDKAFWLTVRNIIEGLFNSDTFHEVLALWQGAAKRAITTTVPEVVQVTLKQHKLPESMHSGILDHLVREGDFTQYGLGNAVTRYSQDVAAYDTAHQLEEIGAEIMSMSQPRWSGLMQAAAALADA
jgi:hypothetical protein